MNQLTSPNGVPALPDEWAERIFQRMENFYMAKWADSFGGIPRDRVKLAWAEELADYSASEIKRGLETCRVKPWPPTLPEFLVMCRPSVDSKTDWMEACEQMPIRLHGNGADKWSRPQVYWAAVKVGAFDLQSNAWDQIKARWIAALENAKSDPIPEYRAALPSPGKQTVTKTEAVDRVAELKTIVQSVSLLGTTKAGTKWAYTLMEREANGEHIESIAADTWREALGYARDISAKKALAGVKGRASA